MPTRRIRRWHLPFVKDEVAARLYESLVFGVESRGSHTLLLPCGAPSKDQTTILPLTTTSSSLPHTCIALIFSFHLRLSVTQIIPSLLAATVKSTSTLNLAATVCISAASLARRMTHIVTGSDKQKIRIYRSDWLSRHPPCTVICGSVVLRLKEMQRNIYKCLFRKSFFSETKTLFLGGMLERFSYSWTLHFFFFTGFHSYLPNVI